MSSIFIVYSASHMMWLPHFPPDLHRVGAFCEVRVSDSEAGLERRASRWLPQGHPRAPGRKRWLQVRGHLAVVGQTCLAVWLCVLEHIGARTTRFLVTFCHLQHNGVGDAWRCKHLRFGRNSVGVMKTHFCRCDEMNDFVSRYIGYQSNKMCRSASSYRALQPLVAEHDDGHFPLVSIPICFALANRL